MARLSAQEFERLASLTRLGTKARAMARMTLVEGLSMRSVARQLNTIPKRARLAVGSIHRVQASRAWNDGTAVLVDAPSPLVASWRALHADLVALTAAPLDDQLLAELLSLLGAVRQRVKSA